MICAKGVGHKYNNRVHVHPYKRLYKNHHLECCIKDMDDFFYCRKFVKGMFEREYMEYLKWVKVQ